MVKLSDAPWKKYRHINLEIIQCDCQEKIERISKKYNKKIITKKIKKENTNI